jgi:hypothetical protein
MRVTLRDLLRNCRLALKKFLNKRDKWVKEWAGQVSWLNTNGKPDRVKGTASRMTPESHKMKVSCLPLWAMALVRSMLEPEPEA